MSERSLGVGALVITVLALAAWFSNTLLERSKNLPRVGTGLAQFLRQVQHFLAAFHVLKELRCLVCARGGPLVPTGWVSHQPAVHRRGLSPSSDRPRLGGSDCSGRCWHLSGSGCVHPASLPGSFQHRLRFLPCVERHRGCHCYSSGFTPALATGHVITGSR